MTREQLLEGQYLQERIRELTLAISNIKSIPATDREKTIRTKDYSLDVVIPEELVQSVCNILLPYYQQELEKAKADFEAL